MSNSRGDRLAALYDWHNDRVLDGQAADLRYWCQLITPPSRVAVLGAGTGRIAVPLAGTGVDVVALDRDLHRLRRIQAGTASVLCGDFTRLPLRGAFDHLVLPYNTLQLVRPDRLGSVLEGVARLLGSHGRAWIDVSDRFARRVQHDWRVVLEDECVALGGRVREWQRGRLELDHFHLETRYELDDVLVARSTDQWFFHHDATLRAAFLRSGLAVRTAATSYDVVGPNHRRIYELSRSDDEGML